MKHLLIVSLFAFATSAGVIAEESVSNERISEISQRLEGYSTDSLVERRNFLISYQKGDEQEDSDGVPAGSASERAIEISIIEALLVALGIAIFDNVSEDSVTPPDTVFPVITILGDNPATVELGSSYTDAGATSDGGETVYEQKRDGTRGPLVSKSTLAKDVELAQSEIEMHGVYAVQLRKKYPALKKAWDKYKLIWNMVHND